MASLQVLTGKSSGQTLDLSGLRGEVLLGTRRTAGLIVRDPWVSFSHAALIRQGEGYAVVDRQSRAGTFVNGQRVGATPVALRDGDVIALGQTEVRFQAQGAAAAAPAGGVTPSLARGPFEPHPAGDDPRARVRAEYESQLAALRQAVAGRERALAEARARERSLHERLEQVESLPTVDPQALLEAEAEAERWRQACEETAAKARSRLEEVTRHAQALEARLAQSAGAGQAATLEQQLAQLREQARARFHALQEELARAQADGEASRRRAAELEATLGREREAREQLMLTSGARAGQAAELQALEQALTDQRREAEALEQALDEAREGLARREQELDALRREQRERALAAAGAGANTAAATDAAAASEEASLLEARCAQLTRELEEARAEADGLRHDLEDINEDMLAMEEEYQQRIAALEAQLGQGAGA